VTDKKRWSGVHPPSLNQFHALCVGISPTTNGASRQQTNRRRSTHSLGLPVSLLAAAANTAAVVTGATGDDGWGRWRPVLVLRTSLMIAIGTGVLLILWLLRLLQTGNTARWNRPRRPRHPPTHEQTATTRIIPKIRNNPSQISSHLWGQTRPRRNPSRPHTDNRRPSNPLSRNQPHGHLHPMQPPFTPVSIPFSNRTPRSQSPSSSPTSIQTPRWPSHTST
jgi:hypothetical protein